MKQTAIIATINTYIFGVAQVDMKERIAATLEPLFSTRRASPAARQDWDVQSSISIMPSCQR